MSEYDLHEWRAEQELAMEKELRDIQPMFQFVVTTPHSTYYCRVLETDKLNDGRHRIKLTDVWVQDPTLVRRMVPSVTAIVREYEAVLLAHADDDLEIERIGHSL